MSTVISISTDNGKADMIGTDSYLIFYIVDGKIKSKGNIEMKALAPLLAPLLPSLLGSLTGKK